MIGFYKHNEINEAKWNQCISSSAHPVVFAKYQFLSKASPEWCALILGDYEAVMPLPCKKKYGLSYIYTPYFFSRLGIFAARTIEESEIVNFLKEIPKKFLVADLAFYQDWSHIIPCTKQRVSYQLPLDSSYDILYQDFSTNHKRNIKNALKYQLVIDKNIPVEEIISLFKNNRGKDKMIKIKDADYGFFLQLTRWALDARCIGNWGVRDEHGQIIAGACFLYDGNRIWFWFSGRDERYFEKRAMFFLMNEFLKCHAGQPYVFDFNGSMDSNVARFYQGFGAEMYHYSVISYTPNPLLKPFIKFYQMIHQ